MPADSFVRIWKFVARPNLCGTPACVKPPPRYLPYKDSAYGNRKKNGKIETETRKNVILYLKIRQKRYYEYKIF